MSTQPQTNNLAETEDELRTISFRASADDALQLKILAAKENTSTQAIMRELLTKLLEKNKAVVNG